jgi:hypothetical protein
MDQTYLARTGNPTSIAETTTFTSDEIVDGDETIQGDLIMSGMSGTNGITFPNGVKQLYAMNALTANQTYNTVKTDSYGVISAITSTMIPTTTIPIKVATAYGSYSGSYISFTINTSSGGTSGSWAQNAYFTICYNISVDYNASSSSPNQLQNNGTASGAMNIWPYSFGSNWCAVANAPSLAQLPNAINGNSNYNMTDSGSTNIGGAIAPSGIEFWSYAATTSGTNVFYLNGTKSSIVFQLTNPSGWSSGSSYTYSITIELLNTGAASGTVYTNGFNSNF